MSDAAPQQIKALIIDWRIHALYDLTGAIFEFLVLPWGGGDQPTEAVGMAPLGLNRDDIRRLRDNLDELLRLMDRSPGQSDAVQ
jgi:hypothetical protein